MEDFKYTYFYELHTEYGPLYIYKRYKTDPSEPFNREIPETREFFTQEEARIGYSDLNFLDDTVKFVTEDRDFEGQVRHCYLEGLHPYDFLMRVAPYLETDEDKEQKRQEVYDIFKRKAENLGNNKIITSPKEVSVEQKNKVASKILAKYLKNEKGNQ